MTMLSLLIVEDEAIIAADLAAKVRQMGYSVAASTTTGEEAIELTRRLKPSLVLMDIRLAGKIDGIEAARQIHSQFQLPVLFLTAHSDIGTVARAQQAEAVGYVLKPFDERDLRIQIEMALYKHATEKRLRESEEQLAAFNKSLQEANTRLVNSRRATINIMEDAVLARQNAEKANAELLREAAERKLAEDALRASEKRFRDIANASADWIWEIDRQGVYTYASEKVQQVLGYEPEEIIGRTPFDLMPPGEAERVRRDFQILADRQEPMKYYTNTTLHKNGTVRYFLTSGVPVYDAQGGLSGYRGVDKDITVRRLAEMALQKSHEELDQKVMERTAELTRLNAQLTAEIVDRRKAEDSLQTAYEEIKRLKDRFEAENIYLQKEIASEFNFGEIIGNSAVLESVYLRIKQVAPMNANVLLLGETGSGKGVVARTIHSHSSRKARPMITVNCSALPATLIESELFGRERGAFTGADARQIGRFELADGGTLFLDEIGEMPLELQSKILRVVQDGEFERLGSSRTIKVDVRIIAASNRNLEEECRVGRFREDLFYRLNVFPIIIPPLRQRKEDIPLLVNHFVLKFNKKINKKVEKVSKETLSSLQKYHWPGNVRELESVIERAVIISQGTTLEVLDRFEASHKVSPDAEQEVKGMSEVERDHILKALRKTDWRISGENGAAELLDLNPSTLRGRMRKYGIKRRFQE